MVLTPMLTVTVTVTVSSAPGCMRMVRAAVNACNASISDAAVPASVLGSNITNSSPPNRATTSLARRASWKIACATARSTSSSNR